MKDPYKKKAKEDVFRGRNRLDETRSASNIGILSQRVSPSH